MSALETKQITETEAGSGLSVTESFQQGTRTQTTPAHKVMRTQTTAPHVVERQQSTPETTVTRSTAVHRGIQFQFTLVFRNRT